MEFALIDLDRENSELGNTFYQLAKYPKYKSVCAMAIAGLPVSKSIIVGSLDRKTRTMLENKINQWGVKEYIVRTDKEGGALYAPSSQNCPIDKVWQNVRMYLKQGLLPLVMAQGDVFHNTYSVNIKLEPETVSYYLEIAGPGFCSTDINKRDIVSQRGYLTPQNSLTQSRVVNHRYYLQQVAVLKESVIQKETAKGVVFASERKAKRWVNSYLISIGALIMKHPTYTPITRKHLKAIRDYIPKIKTACRLLGYGNIVSVISMSFVLENGRENPYFWKIHPYSGYHTSKT